MRKLLCILAMVFGFTLAAIGQTAPECPAQFVCLTPAAARSALEAGDKAKALEAENKDLKEKVIPQLKDALNDMRVQYAETKGEATILKQRAISDAAMIELLTKMVRPKKFGIINF
jgi:hypothetical protein